MEEETQLFRLAGTTAVKKIPCDHVDGQSVIYWEDIQQIFPGILHVIHGEVIVKLLRDSNRNRIVPHCIKYHPGVVFDIVLSPSGETSTAPSCRTPDTINTSSADDIVESLQITHLRSPDTSSHDTLKTLSNPSALPLQSPSSGDERSSRTSLSFQQVVKLVQKKAMESEFERRLVSSLPSDLQAKVLNSSSTHEALVQAIKDGLLGRPNGQLAILLGQLKGEIARNNELACKNDQTAMKITELASEVLTLVSENKELLTGAHEQKRALDRQVQLQDSVKTLLTQPYELHEFPIPRLFIVLPRNDSFWNPLDFFDNKFRLYFLCECGEHTKFIHTKIPHHLHLARHGGYDIDRPKEFFRLYGSHVLTIMRMLKFGISVAGVVAPALSDLARPDAAGHIPEGLNALENTLEPGMSRVMDHIEKVSAGKSRTTVRFADQLDKKDASEGSPDLTKLETFLKSQDKKKKHGNLYRSVTAEGQVKWVCIDHFRDHYHEKLAKAFREAVGAQSGSFHEYLGRVDVVLCSRGQAEHFYQALEKARSVYELKVTLDWETTQNDFKRLRDALLATRVGDLTLKFTDTSGPASDFLNRGQRYDPVFDMIQHPSMKSFKIIGPQDLIQRSSLPSRDHFPHLRRLHLSVYDWEDGLLDLKYLIDKVPGLSSLEITTNKSYMLPVYYAVAEHPTCPIVFYDGFGRMRRFRPPPKQTRQSTATIHHHMAYFLKTYSKVDIQDLDKLVISESEASVMTKAMTEDGQGSNGIFLTDTDRFGDATFGSLASIVAQSALREIDLFMDGHEGRLQILASIPWKHLHNLVIRLKRESLARSVMKALVDRVRTLSVGGRRVHLEQFLFLVDSEAGRLIMTQRDDLLQAFIASISCEVLELDVVMTVDQILSLFKPLDVSRLRRLVLWGRGLDAVQVDAVLDGLQHAKKLGFLILDQAVITKEQMDRVKAKGVTLGNVRSVPDTRTTHQTHPGF